MRVNITELETISISLAVLEYILNLIDPWATQEILAHIDKQNILGFRKLYLQRIFGFDQSSDELYELVKEQESDSN